MQKIFPIAVFSSLALSGCATMTNNYEPAATHVSAPALNKVTTASVGDDMLRQGVAETRKGVLLKQENRIDVFTLTPGFYPQVGEKNDRVFTSFAVNAMSPDMGRVITRSGPLIPQGVSFDHNQQKTCVVFNSELGSDHVCDTEHSYEFTQRPVYSSNSFQQSLIYSGRVGNKIKVSYREYSGGNAQNAISDQAEYDLSASHEIAYKGARIKVIKADNQSIEYVVLSDFDNGK